MAPPHDERIDAILDVETPEGVFLSLPVAGPVPRAIAWLMDLMLKGAILWGGAIALAVLNVFGQGLYFILAFCVVWLYSVLFEVYNNGATPGKRMLKLRVVHDDGTPVGWGASMIRNLLRNVDILPFTYAVGLVACLVHPDFKRLGDMAAGTVVVHDSRSSTAAELPQAAAVAPPIALLADEQRAIVSFSQRSRLLTAERRAELAAIPALLTSASTDKAKRLYEMAAWVSGRR